MLPLGVFSGAARADVSGPLSVSDGTGWCGGDQTAAVKSRRVV